jgi:hypothetical protein
MTAKKIKLRIISDGTTAGTKVFDEKTGARVEGVTSVSWNISAGSNTVSSATIQLEFVKLEVVGSATVVDES